MRQYRIFKGIKMALLMVVCAVAFGYITMQLWNWLIPTIFGLRPITFVQAIGLLLLSKILFGGFHHHGHGGGGREWKRHMRERWEGMSEEERQRVRAGMRGRWGCGPFDRHRGKPAEPQVTP